MFKVFFEVADLRFAVILDAAVFYTYRTIFSALSIMNVTGPSFTRCTFIIAWNMPVSTLETIDLAFRTKYS
jgi:hypothetical protein